MKKIILISILFYSFIFLAFYLDSIFGNPEGLWVNECNGDRIIMKNGNYTYLTQCAGEQIELHGKYHLNGKIYFEGTLDPCSVNQPFSIAIIYNEGWFDNSTFTFDGPDIDGCDFIKQ